MKYRIGHYDYNEDRKDNPYLFTVFGTPDTKAEWEQFRGETRETMTLAEIEAKGIALPAAIGQATAEAAKRLDAARIEKNDVTAERDANVAKLSEIRAILER